jgi:hypothetical protein
MRPIEAAKHLAQLEAAGRIVSQSHDGQVYYQLARRAPAKEVSSSACNFSGRRGSISSDPVGSQVSLPETSKQRVKNSK